MNKAYVYILASYKHGTLYVGVSSNLMKRIYEHKTGAIDGFTKKYKIDRLVYYEEGNDIKEAIKREKFIKGKSRKYKISLIEENNPNWYDLSSTWFEEMDSSLRSE